MKQFRDPKPHDAVAQSYINKTKQGVFGFFITRKRLTYILVVAIIVGGIFALTQIPRESDPEVKIPIAIITTVFPGASPADVELLVTDVIEKKIEELDELDLVTSSSINGISSISVEFEAEADLDESIRELKDKILEVRGLPDDAEDPVVTPIRANDFPIITFSLAGNLDDARLKILGELLQDEIESISGVSEAPLLGIRDREFAVVFDAGELNRLNITLGQVVSAIAASNQDIPLGTITLSSVDYNLRTVSKINSLDDLRNIVVVTRGNTPITLSDVARIEDTLSEEKTKSRLSLNGQQSVNTVSLQIFKKTGGNILDIVDEAKERVTELKATGIIPQQVSVEVSSDFSQFIRDDLSTLGRSGIQSIILIFILLLVALSFREATISLLAIPLSFFISFIVLNASGNTLNSLTLFALVLSLGLLVDTFIVVLEGIFHNVREGYSPYDASLLSVGHYVKPLFAGIFTTIAAFVPMLLVSGILGEFLKFLPITITITLLGSLFISFTIVPALASVFLKKGKNNGSEKSILERYITIRLRKAYKKYIHTFLINRKAKIRLTATLVVLFVAGLALLISGVVPVELFPKVDVDFIFVDVEMPVGTDLTVTNEVTKEIEAYLYTRPEIKSFVTTVGRSSMGLDLGGGSRSSEHLANININLRDIEERDVKSYDLAEVIRDDLSGRVKRGKVQLNEANFGPPTGAPIEIRITGDDLKILDELSDRAIQTLKVTEGVIDIESSQEVSPADFTFSFKKDVLARSGLTPAEASLYLRTAIFGVTATEISIDGEDIDVTLKLDKKNIATIEDVKNLSLINREGQSVTLSRIADVSLEPALAAIRHRDFKRTLTIRADLEKDFVPSKVVPHLEETIVNDGIPSGHEIEFGGEVEDIEQSFAELWSALYVAVFLILVILVLQFDSFKKPLAILLVLPLTFIGVMVGMLIFNLAFSFSVFLGMVALVGIVVNDAIVLLDKVNRNIKEYTMSLRDALADAGDARLQPIILTSLTTIFGVVPLAFANEFWFGLSISVIFGLLFATILQLFVVPMVYLKLEGKKISRKRKFRIRFWKKENLSLPF